MSSGQHKKGVRRKAPTIPGIYLYLLGEVMSRLGFDGKALLEGVGVDVASLTQPQSRVSAELCQRATEQALQQAGHLGLGFEYAKAVRVTLHGALGMAVLSSLTLQDALDVAQRYLQLKAPLVRLEYRLEGSQSHIRLVPEVDFGPATLFLMESLLLVLVYTCEQLLGQRLEGVSLHMRGPEPAYYAAQQAGLPVPVAYGAAHWEVQGPAALIKATPTLADPVAAQLARSQCEQEFQQEFGQAKDFTGRLLEHLQAAPEKLPGVEEMATALHMSSRTLKRRLQDEGLTYSDLVEAELKARACELLASTQLPISEVAYRLGYNDVSNFSRAFKRWTGLAASEYRKQR